MSDDLARLAREHIERLVGELEGDDDFMPFMTYTAFDNTRGFVGLHGMGSQEEKDGLADVMGAMLAANRAKEATFASCAWMVKVDDGKTIDVMPSEHPERMEVAVLIYIGEGGDEMHSALIARKDGAVRLGEWDVMPPEQGAAGRFGDVMHMGMTLGKEMPQDICGLLDAAMADDTEAALKPLIKAFRRLRTGDYPQEWLDETREENDAQAEK